TSLGNILFVSELRREPSRPIEVYPIRNVCERSPIPGPRMVGEWLDSVEVLCEAGRVASGGCPANPPQVSSVSDIDAAVDYLNCGADEIHRTSERVVFRGIPTRALDALREQSSIGAYPAVGGEY